MPGLLQTTLPLRLSRPHRAPLLLRRFRVRPPAREIELHGIKRLSAHLQRTRDCLQPSWHILFRIERPLGSRKFQYLFIDGTNFHVRRTTVEREPTLVVIGVDETNRKSVLAMVQGDKDSRAAWEMVFAQLKERGLDASAVKLGIMDGLPGLEAAFREAFLNARTARCWVHKATIESLVDRRLPAEHPLRRFKAQA